MVVQDGRSCVTGRPPRTPLCVAVVAVCVTALGVLAVQGSWLPSPPQWMGVSRRPHGPPASAPLLQLPYREFKATARPLPADRLAYVDQGPRQGRIMYLYHIHKTGGTSMCFVARTVAGETPLPHHANCNMPGPTDCCGRTADAQRLYAAVNVTRDGTTFIANERVMADEMDLTRYKYVVFFRDPLQRATSQYNHMVRAKREYAERPYLPPYEEFLLGPGADVNFMTNRLSARSHSVAEAVAKVKHMVVALLERPDDSMELLSHEFEWPPVQLPRKNAWELHVKPTDPQRGAVSMLTDDQIMRFRRLNADDYTLYNAAVAVHEAQVANMRIQMAAG